MINFIILANSKTSFLKSMTMTCIESILQSCMPKAASLDKLRIIVVESHPDVVHDKVITLSYDQTKYDEFNYNYALNIGIDYCQQNFSDNDWYVFMNNDVVVSQKWLLQIAAAVTQIPDLDSLCPNIRQYENCVRFGYTLQKHLDGCCIMCKAQVIDKIGKFDEAFPFYFQDDDYLEQLRLHHVKHGKVMSSLITHLGSQTLPEDESIRPLLFRCRDIFIKKYGLQTYLAREKEKHAR